MKIKKLITLAIATTLGLVVYFLILSLFGLHINPIFSLFNGVILGIGLYRTMLYLKEEGGVSLFNGYANTIFVGFLSTLLFTVFFIIYAEEIHPNFLEQLITGWYDYFEKFEAAVFFTVAIMGFASTLAWSLIFYLYFKPSQNLSHLKG